MKENEAGSARLHTSSLSLSSSPLLSVCPYSNSKAPPPPRKHLSVHVSNLLTAPPSLYLVFSHIHKTLIHPIPVFPLICYRFHTWRFPDSLHTASKHYTHMLLLCLILNPGPLMCCHSSLWLLWRLSSRFWSLARVLSEVVVQLPWNKLLPWGWRHRVV